MIRRCAAVGVEAQERPRKGSVIKVGSIWFYMVYVTIAIARSQLASQISG